MMVEVRRYITATGKDVVGGWLAELKDVKARAGIAARIDRLALGNFGDCKSLGHYLHELRIDCGPGYRLYYTMQGKTCVLLLCGGDKSKQFADILRARSYLEDHRKRTGAS